MIIADAPDFRGLSRFSAEELRKKYVELAEFIVEDNTSRIPKRIAYDGFPQKANAASTVKRKGHSTPLLDKRVLIDKGRYRLVAGEGRRLVSILPPLSRMEPLRHLLARGYRYWGVSTEARQFATKELGLAWENAKRRAGF